MHSNQNAKKVHRKSPERKQAPFEFESTDQRERATPPRQRSPQKSDGGVPNSGEADSRKKSCSEFGDNQTKLTTQPLLEAANESEKGHKSMRRAHTSLAGISIEMSDSLVTSTVDEQTEETCTVDESVTVTTLSVAEPDGPESEAQQEDRLEREE